MLAILQKAFAGKTSARAKLGMILASNLFISPIQQSVYIAAMAIINGATTPQAIINAWKMSIWRVMKLSWVVSTVSMAIAQRFLAPEIWVRSQLSVGVPTRHADVLTSFISHSAVLHRTFRSSRRSFLTSARTSLSSLAFPSEQLIGQSVGTLINIQVSLKTFCLYRALSRPF